jgi:streptogramin lyase
VSVTGLPDGVIAKVKLTGPAGTSTELTASRTLADAPAGTYAVTAERVANANPIVRTVYEAKVSAATLCLAGAQTVTIAYSAVASSNKLWASNQNSSSDLVAFASADLGATGSPAATVAVKGPVGKAIAFDKEGNLWTAGGTIADPPLARFAAADLGASGTKTPDRKVVPTLTGCSPALTAIAFAPSGDLWAADLCADRLLHFSPETLAASRDYTPAADDLATGTIHGPRGVAFDASGNMWVSDATSLHYYPAASLAPGQPHVPTFKLDAATASAAELPPDALAFDKDGNLWVTSFGGNIIYKLTPADLAPAGASKSVVPSVQMAVSVGALLESLSFDESGGLWLTFSQGKVARIAPPQLGTSTNAGAPTVPEAIVTSADLGYANGTAFFPAAAGLPIYSSFR